MKYRLVAFAVSALLAGSSWAGEVSGGPFSLLGSTAIGGGGTSSGEEFSLTGSAGQPEAGFLQGGPYTLLGGFYGVIDASTGEPTLVITLDAIGNVFLQWNLDGYTLEFRDS